MEEKKNLLVHIVDSIRLVVRVNVVILAVGLLIGLGALFATCASGCQQPPADSSPDAAVCYVTAENEIDPCDSTISFSELDKLRDGLEECRVYCCNGVEICPTGLL